MFFSKEQYLNRREIRNLIYFISFFFWLVFSYSLFSAFYLPIFLSVLAVFLGALIFSYCLLRWLHPARLQIYILSSSLILSQLVWLINILPFNHWTVGALLLIVYFVFWDIIRMRLQGALSKGLVMRDLIFGVTATMLILLSSRIIV